ncbi:MAG: transcriptional regulator [Massilia sp.]|jgi:transcriptional regulator
MYIPAKTAETRPAALHALMAAYPLGTLVSHGAQGLDADHLPFEIAPGAGTLGVLRAHVARANPLWRNDGGAVMVVFRGESGYEPPSAGMRHPGDTRVVPTWNYSVVHAHGRLRTVDDPAWIMALLRRQSAVHESAQARPWSPDDAPADFIDSLLKAIVGIEIVIERLDGKRKSG